MGGGGDFVLNFVLWMVVPGTVASFIQSRYYAIVKRGSSPRPGSPRFRKHYDNIYCLTIGSYLIYCIYSVISGCSPNFYSAFGTNRRNFDVKELRSKYRTLSLQLHPDKNPTQQAAEQFAEMKRIYETLNSPDKRLIYDKFGDFQCSGCSTFRDHFYSYLPGAVMFYGFSTMVLIIMNVAGRKDYAQSLRYMAILFFLAAELHLLSREWDPLDSFWAFRSLTAAQKVKIMRECSVYFFMFLSQLCPILFPDDDSMIGDEHKKSEELAGVVDREIKTHVLASLDPFHECPEMMEKLKRQIELSSVEMKLFEMDENYRNKYVDALLKKK